MYRKFILWLALAISVRFGSSFGGEPHANAQPQNLVHKWAYITFSRQVPEERERPVFMIGYENENENAFGLRLDIENITRGFGFFKTNAIAARLYRANGEIVEPTMEGKKLLNTPMGVGSFVGEPIPQVVTYFPWGTNSLEESWIEVSISPERYWLELPYGFDKDPKKPLSPATASGPPNSVTAMKSLCVL